MSLIIIQDYQKFNMMGFQKIMKQFDKNLSCDNGADWLTTKFSDSELNNAEETEKLIVKVNFIWTIMKMNFALRLKNCLQMSWERETERRP